MIAVNDDIGHILAENPPGAFRRLVDSWPAASSVDEVLDGLESAGYITPLQRPLAQVAVRGAQGTGLPYFAVDLAVALERVTLTVRFPDDPAMATAALLASVRR